MLRVMADNMHAINFYRKCNFVDAEMIPLVCDVSPDRKVYRDATGDEKPKKYFLKMNYCPLVLLVVNLFLHRAIYLS